MGKKKIETMFLVGAMVLMAVSILAQGLKVFISWLCALGALSLIFVNFMSCSWVELSTREALTMLIPYLVSMSTGASLFYQSLQKQKIISLAQIVVIFFFYLSNLFLVS